MSVHFMFISGDLFVTGLWWGGGGGVGTRGSELVLVMCRCVPMAIELALYRARIGLFNRYRKVKAVISLTFISYAMWVLLLEIFMVIFLMLIRCGDVEINPGPSKANISLWSSNVRGLNLDMLDCILADVVNNFDILGISETFLNTASDINLLIPGYLPIFRKDRVGHGGGVALYVSDSCTAKRLEHFEYPNIEALWVEVRTQSHVLAVCVCYRSRTEGK